MSEDSKNQHRSFIATVDWVAKNYDLGNDENARQQAKKLIAFHGKIVGEISGLLTQGQITPRFDPKSGIASSSLGVAENGVGAIPILGGAIAAGVSLLKKAVGFAEKKAVIDDLEVVKGMNDSGEIDVWLDFAGDIATRVMEEKKDEILASPNRGAARDLAEEDSKKIIEKIFDRNLVKDRTLSDGVEREELLEIFSGTKRKIDEVSFSRPAGIAGDATAEPLAKIQMQHF